MYKKIIQFLFGLLKYFSYIREIKFKCRAVKRISYPKTELFINIKNANYAKIEFWWESTIR